MGVGGEVMSGIRVLDGIRVVEATVVLGKISREMSENSTACEISLYLPF